LLLELLVAVLELLDRTRELADLRLKLIDADRQIGLVRAGALLTLLSAEQIVEEIAGTRGFLIVAARSTRRIEDVMTSRRPFGVRLTYRPELDQNVTFRLLQNANRRPQGAPAVIQLSRPIRT
jgi:hypothetical protein